MKFFDRVRVGTATTGQGVIALGSAADGDMMSFAEAGAIDGDQITYILTEGQDFEVGRGTIGGDVTTMTRDTVLVSKISGSVGTGKMELAGTAVVTNVYGAVDANRMLALAGRHASMGEVVKNAGWSVAASEAGAMLIYNSTSGGTATLPAVASSNGEVYHFRAINTGTLTIDPDGAEQIEGAATLALPQGRSAIVWPNESKTAWRAVILLAPSAAALGLVVRGDAAQSFSAGQKAQAQVNIGALGASISAKSANYTVTTGDAGAAITVDASGGARTVTLPPAATAGEGFKLVVKKADTSSNTVTIDGDGSETIDGATTRVLRLPYQSAALICDGTKWHVMAAAAEFERGSNPNGAYVRYASGIQECWGSLTFTGGDAATVSATWTYPAAFSSTPFSTFRSTSAPAAAARERSYWGNTPGLTTSAFSMSMNTNFPSGFSEAATVFAKGAWF